jgi:hypothetical protein
MGRYSCRKKDPVGHVAAESRTVQRDILHPDIRGKARVVWRQFCFVFATQRDNDADKNYK